MTTYKQRVSSQDNPFEPFAHFMQPGPESFVRMVQPMMAATASMIEMQAKLCHAGAQASREWFDFVGRRLEMDAKLMKDMQGAWTPQAFMNTWMSFARRMATDYGEEFAELSRLSSKATGGTCEVMRDKPDNVTPFGESTRHP